MKKLTPVSLLSLLSVTGFAQRGTGNILNYKGVISKQRSVYAEAQTRSRVFYNRLYYYEAKAAVNYHFSKNFSVTADFGHTTVTPIGVILNSRSPVTSTWVQLFIAENFGRIHLDNRPIEQR